MTRRWRMLCAAACAALSLVASMGYARASAAQAADARRAAIEQSGHDAVSVVVAKRELSAGERVTRTDVEQSDWIGEYVPEGALADLGDCVDRQLTSAVPAGAVLCDVNFRTGNENEGVPSGYVAINLQLTKNLGVSADCAPGTNAIAYVVGSGAAGVSLASANARILAVHPASSGLTTDTLTLAVLPDDVTAVVAATRNDSLRLVLPADDVASIPDGVQLARTGEEGTEPGPTEVPPVDESQGEQTGAGQSEREQMGE